MCGCVVTDVSVDAQLTVKPSNTAALLGSKVVLQCATSTWFYDRTLIVISCSVETGYTSQYSVNKTETGRCDLIINEATLDMAGEYKCYPATDRRVFRAIVQLTVIGESLVLIVCICFILLHLLQSDFFSEVSFFNGCIIPVTIIPPFTSLLSRLYPHSPGFYVDCLLSTFHLFGRPSIQYSVHKK